MRSALENPVEHVINELFVRFYRAEGDGDANMVLESAVGSRFHATVYAAAKQLGIPWEGYFDDARPIQAILESKA